MGIFVYKKDKILCEILVFEHHFNIQVIIIVSIKECMLWRHYDKCVKKMVTRDLMHKSMQATVQGDGNANHILYHSEILQKITKHIY